MHDELRQVSDTDLAMRLIGSLPLEEHQSLIVSLDVMGEDKICFEIVKQLLVSGAERRSGSGAVVGDAKVAQTSGPRKLNGNCHRCEKQGHMARNCKSNGNGNGKQSNAKIVCHPCRQKGHIARVCNVDIVPKPHGSAKIASGSA